MTSAILWILVFYPPNGGTVILPFGYKTSKMCQSDGKRISKFSEEHDQGKTGFKCFPSSKAKTFNGYMRKTK